MANRQAIIDANPSLQDDPDRVIVGKAYVIPTAGERTTVVAEAPTALMAQGNRLASISIPSRKATTFRPSRMTSSAIPRPSMRSRNSNQRILKGENRDVVVPGMKLRLPAKPVATATN